MAHAYGGFTCYGLSIEMLMVSMRFERLAIVRSFLRRVHLMNSHVTLFCSANERKVVDAHVSMVAVEFQYHPWDIRQWEMGPRT